MTMRQRQSRPPLASDRMALQQSAVGEVPLAELLARKFMQGVKEESMEAVHGVLVWPFAGRTATRAKARSGRKGPRSFILGLFEPEFGAVIEKQRNVWGIYRQERQLLERG